MNRTATQPGDHPPTSASTRARQDRWFFAGLTLLLLATALVGFGPSYYLAGMLRASLPSKTIHVHAIVFTLWLVFLAAQVAFVSAHRVDLHRRFGPIAFGLAGVVALSGLTAGADTLRRNIPPGQAELLFIVNTSMAATFAGLMALAWLWRRDPPAHKRLILVANIAFSFAGLIRWPVPWLYHQIPNATRASYAFLLLLVLYDLWSMRRIHRATLWSSLLLVTVCELRPLISTTMPWQALAAWIRS